MFTNIVFIKSQLRIRVYFKKSKKNIFFSIFRLKIILNEININIKINFEDQLSLLKSLITYQNNT